LFRRVAEYGVRKTKLAPRESEKDAVRQGSAFGDGGGQHPCWQGPHEPRMGAIGLLDALVLH
jgi:hypothetical protein